MVRLSLQWFCPLLRVSSSHKTQVWLEESWTSSRAWLPPDRVAFLNLRSALQSRHRLHRQRCPESRSLYLNCPCKASLCAAWLHRQLLYFWATQRPKQCGNLASSAKSSDSWQDPLPSQQLFRWLFCVQLMLCIQLNHLFFIDRIAWAQIWHWQA